MEKFNSGVFATYMIVSAAVGAIASLILVLVDDIFALRIIMSVVSASLITAIISGLAYLPLLLKLRQITERLESINTRKRTTDVQPLPFGILDKLTRETNTIVENQTDFQTMRGRLYEQISEVAAQEERNRLARDLHDSIKQQVFSMSVSATAAHVHLESNIDAARAALNDVRQSAQEAMVEMRVLLQQLAPAPLEQSGLVESIKQQLEALSFRTGASVSSEFDKLPSNELLPIGAQETIFRITQEALSNIARHARARQVALTLKHDVAQQCVILSITDDGQGFDMSKIQRGMGLNNMERRIEDLDAEITLNSKPGTGTTLIAQIPLEHDDPVKEMLDRRAESKKLEEKVYHQYLAVAMVSAGIIFSGTLLVRGVVNDISAGIITFLLLMLITCVVGFRVLWQKYQEQSSTFKQQVAEDDPAQILIRQHKNEALWIVLVGLAFVVPGGFVGIDGLLWLPTAIGLSVFFALELSMFNILRYHHRYLQQLHTSEFTETMKRLQITLVIGIATTVFIAATVILPGTGHGIYLRPQDSEQWDSNFFIAMVAMFTIYHIALSGLYIYWRYIRTDQPELMEQSI